MATPARLPSSCSIKPIFEAPARAAITAGESAAPQEKKTEIKQANLPEGAKRLDVFDLEGGRAKKISVPYSPGVSETGAETQMIVQVQSTEILQTCHNDTLQLPRAPQTGRPLIIWGSP